MFSAVLKRALAYQKRSIFYELVFFLFDMILFLIFYNCSIIPLITIEIIITFKLRFYAHVSKKRIDWRARISYYKIVIVTLIYIRNQHVDLIWLFQIEQKSSIYWSVFMHTCCNFEQLYIMYIFQTAYRVGAGRCLLRWTTIYDILRDHTNAFLTNVWKNSTHRYFLDTG